MGIWILGTEYLRLNSYPNDVITNLDKKVYPLAMEQT